ncbi:NosD domain-containing protein [Methanolobus bombayensis]|uniref:NosD domain-containing protein n=1 Tax=Methanolobus bombayensis TaxID=38023 RepID=UPI001AE1FF3B|nr:right-handed parallel beta-helix repeat-containing protein [Methanolobus bombayensis]MBP1909981.1 PGF-pre-PGF domain-containing protein [Methanolobus bombayensis]
MRVQRTYIISVLFMCILLSCTGIVSAEEIMVGSGYGNTTITAALANASNGDIITVTDGTYIENVDVTKEVTIRSQNGAASTTVQASSSSDHVFYVNADNTNISGFNITGATDSIQAGIYLHDYSSSNTLTNNTVNGNYYGIYLSDSDGNTLTNNTASNNEDHGIYLYSSSSNTLTNNTASNNTGYGINVYSYSSSNILTNNIASNNSYYGIRLDYGSSSNTLTDNTASNNEDHGIYLRYNADSNTLTNNTASNNNDYGIYLDSSDSNTLTNNTASNNNDYGIYLVSSDSNTLTNNTATGNNYGIYLLSGISNTLSNNNASNNTNYGIKFNADSSTLTNNIASGNGDDGISVSCENSILTNNTVSNNSDCGIFIIGSTNVTMTGNIMSQNTYDFRINDGSVSNFLHNIDSSNLVDNKPIYYWSSLSDEVISANASTMDAGVIYLVNCSNVSVADYNVVNASGYQGVVFAHTDDSTMENITVSGGYYGSYFYYSDNNMLTDSNFSDADQRCVYIYNSNNYTLANNSVYDNSNYGIYLYSTNEITITDNTLSGNRFGICPNNAINSTATNNTFSGNTYGIYTTYSSCDYAVLTGNVFINNSNCGINLNSGDGNTVANSTFRGNNQGIYLNGGSSNTLADNMFSGNNYGVYLYRTSSNTVSDNIINGSSYTGIYLSTASGNIITGNIANGNRYGIDMSGSGNNNVLTNNAVINNEDFDYRSYSSGSNNTIDMLELLDGSSFMSFVADYSQIRISGNDTHTVNLSGQTNVNGYVTITRTGNLSVTFFYNDSGISSSDEATIALYRLNGSTWEEITGTTLDTSANSVSDTLSEFGTLALFTGGRSDERSSTTPSSSSDDDDGVRASVSQGQDPAIVASSASSVKRITGDSEVNYDFSDSGTPVLGISFDAKKDKGLVVAKVQVLSGNPDGVSNPSGKSYQMLSIDVGSEGTVSSDSADNVMIHFKVSKEWIEENNIDISTIRMTRYHGDQWNDLETYQVREEGEYIYFYAETPGFSVFNVVGDEISETSEQASESTSIVEEEGEPVDEEETPDTPGFTALAGIVVVSLAFFVSRKQKSE